MRVFRTSANSCADVERGWAVPRGDHHRLWGRRHRVAWGRGDDPENRPANECTTVTTVISSPKVTEPAGLYFDDTRRRQVGSFERSSVCIIPAIRQMPNDIGLYDVADTLFYGFQLGEPRR